MRLSDAHAKLLALKLPALTTADAAGCLRIPPGHASKLLERLADSGHLTRLRRGVWAMGSDVQMLALPQHLVAPFPCYVSLQSALYYHGMTSQMPSATYAVSLARTQRYSTPLGDVSIHHIAPTFFFGFQRVGEQGAQLALPEKALLDVLYLGPAKTRLFAALPELERPRSFSVRRARAMANRIPSMQRRTLVLERLERILRIQGWK